MERNMNLNDVLSFIYENDLSREQLTDIHNALNDKLRAQYDARNAKARSQFRVGQKVTFFSTQANRQVVGRIAKINRATVTVEDTEASHMAWRVSPSLLKAV